jgi:phospholipid transport system substrate-binding protein
LKKLYKQTYITINVCFWCIVLIMSLPAYNVYANESNSNTSTEIKSESNSDTIAKDAKDPNELLWKKWDAAIKDPNDPNEILQVKWNSIMNVLQNKDSDMELKKKIIDKIMSPIFDADLMAKLSLGRTNWPKLNSQQQKDFTKLFAERIKSFYLEKTTLYNDQKISFKPATKNKNNIYIPMSLISNNKEISILYKLHEIDDAEKKKQEGYWKIYDVEIEGVSVLMTYQSQFDDILRQGGIKDLFEQLEKPPVK